MDRDDLIVALRAQLASHAAIACAWLFGSRARGDARPGSDVDVAVLYAGDAPSTLSGSGIALAGELERAIGREVDVVVANTAPDDLMHRVLRDGVLLFDRDPGARVRFEVASRARWFDLKPVLDRYRGTAERARG